LEKFRKNRNRSRPFEKSEKYMRTINCIETDKGQSAWFKTRSGVGQGNVLQILFNVMMNDVCSKIKEK
jgi:hypothetical protein